MLKIILISLLVLIILLVICFFLGKLLLGKLIKRIFSMPFKAKGKVLKNAAVEIHDISKADCPDIQGTEEREGG